MNTPHAQQAHRPAHPWGHLRCNGLYSRTGNFFNFSCLLHIYLLSKINACSFHHMFMCLSTTCSLKPHVSTTCSTTSPMRWFLGLCSPLLTSQMLLPLYDCGAPNQAYNSGWVQMGCVFPWSVCDVYDNTDQDFDRISSHLYWVWGQLKPADLLHKNCRLMFWTKREGPSFAVL